MGDFQRRCQDLSNAMNQLNFSGLGISGGIFSKIFRLKPFEKIFRSAKLLLKPFLLL